jgi:oxygen-independent coproporphyrinogen-3 oxidase
MPFTAAMQQYFWLYWRLYETSVPKDALAEKFMLPDKKLKQMFNISKRFGLLRENAESFRLTVSGAFWIHYLQNYFSLRYIDKIWSIAMKEAYPAEIRL